MTSEAAKVLAKLHDQLNVADQYALVSFAQFLLARSMDTGAGAEEIGMEEPNILPAKEGESVVAAIKRLRASYPMLSRKEMLDKVSVLMAQHVMNGRDKDEVIADLELLFNDAYQSMSEKGK